MLTLKALCRRLFTTTVRTGKTMVVKPGERYRSVRIVGGTVVLDGGRIGKVRIEKGGTLTAPQTAGESYCDQVDLVCGSVCLDPANRITFTTGFTVT